MAGTLSHSTTFTRVDYIGHDGLPHFEVRSDDGGDDTVSVSSFREVVDYFAEFGIAPAAWPIGQECGIDLDVDALRATSDRLRDKIVKLTLPPDAPGLAVRIREYLVRGETIVFCP